MKYLAASMAFAASALAAPVPDAPATPGIETYYNLYATGLDASGNPAQMDIYPTTHRGTSFVLAVVPVGTNNHTVGYVNAGDLFITIPDHPDHFAGVTVSQPGPGSGMVNSVYADLDAPSDGEWSIAKDGSVLHKLESVATFYLCPEKINGIDYQIIKFGNQAADGGPPGDCTRVTSLTAVPDSDYYPPAGGW